MNCLDCICGTHYNGPSRIIGGQETDVNEYPWQVGLLFSTFSDKTPGCGGSIISNRHILTAAHCTAGQTTSTLRVLLGEHDTSDSVQDIRTISAITDHPGYDSSILAYDASILTLTSPIIFSRTMSPVCLPAVDSKQFTGEKAIVSGWGWGFWGGSSSSKLMEVDVTVTSNAVCNNEMDEYKRITGRQLPPIKGLVLTLLHYHNFIYIYMYRMYLTVIISVLLTMEKDRVKEIQEALCLYRKMEGLNLTQSSTT